MHKSKHPATICLHEGYQPTGNAPLIMPIYQTSTFVFESCEFGGECFSGEQSGNIYTRLGNPNFHAVEAKIAALEGAEAAVLTSSGMGAIAATLWTLLSSGDHLIAAKTIYGCTFSLFSHHLSRFGIEVEFIDFNDLSQLANALKANTKAIFFETPANPDLSIYDIRKISTITHQYNPEIKVIIDNTFATPILQQPIKLGADIVVHSATKALNGHSDIISGVVVGKAELMQRIQMEGIKDLTGAVPSPHDASLLLRGLKTLSIRVKTQNEQTMRIATALENHPAIEKVIFPGLSSHPQHELATQQMTGFGNIISFNIKGGFDAAKKMLNNVELCALAVSLGCVHTLIQHPASMTHSAYSAEELANAGIANNLIRISIGLEDYEDIWSDLNQALNYSQI